MRFRAHDEVRPLLQQACKTHDATFLELGRTEQGRSLDAVVMGRGERRVSLVAGAHSDEPVGPETLRELILDPPQALLDEWEFVVVPHINPDGEARNRAWTERWPDAAAHLNLAFREKPGRDIEFGYPDMRVENRLVAGLLQEHAPFALHMSLHGMAVAEGAMLLVERHWIDRTQELRAAFVEAARADGLRMHDHDRKGEKGFTYIEAGFWTTPEGAAMREHFENLGDPDTAALFHQSSMEFVRSLGGDPLCLVTELPLFVLDNENPQPGTPTAYLAFMERLRIGEPSVGAELGRLRPLDLRTAVRLQRRTLELGLAAV